MRSSRSNAQMVSRCRWLLTRVWGYQDSRISVRHHLRMQFLRFRKLEGVNLELDSADATVFDDNQNRMMRNRPWRKMMGSLSHICNPNQLPHHDDCLPTSTMSLKAFTEVSYLIQEWRLSCGLYEIMDTHGMESRMMSQLL